VQVALGPPEALGPAPASGSFEAPIVSRGERIGTMRISTPPETRPFLSENRALFTSLGESLGLALEALQLREKKLEQERSEQELRLLASRAELRALRAQINPHFIFNALNAIAELVATNPAKAETTVERLAEVLRGTLRRSDREWARIDDELALVRAYLEVERIRFGSRLEVFIEAQNGSQALVPTMMIQTLVENAVKHGVSQRPGPGRIEVRVSRSDGSLRVEVRDSGPGFEAGGPPIASVGMGLRNVRERLAAHFGSAAALRVERDEEAGMTVVAIVLPFSLTAPSASEVEVS